MKVSRATWPARERLHVRLFDVFHYLSLKCMIGYCFSGVQNGGEVCIARRGCRRSPLRPIEHDHAQGQPRVVHRSRAPHHSINIIITVVTLLGSITKAVQKAKEVGGFALKIEVECRSLDEAREALTAGADIVMLDNFKVRCHFHSCSSLPYIVSWLMLIMISLRWPKRSLRHSRMNSRTV